MSASMSQADAEKELQSRPSYEQGSKDYLAMLAEMRGVFDELAPDLKWTQKEPAEVSSGICAPPFQKIEAAESGTFEAGYAQGSTPDAAWPEAKQKLIDIAAQYGFTVVNELRDAPQDRAITISNGQDGTVEFGDYGNTTLAVNGSCLLHENATSGNPSGG
ncbi:hypothetical protein GCM10022223_06350 [Kineosporia mesophila]|uniref:LppA-like lipoprotein n=1 Tax=Kineosporia mesophila TaxID=566012 RepID=A0ABP6Z179_9ACTN|nr:LppA family lipoprotein [Kineosporia mesophila]